MPARAADSVREPGDAGLMQMYQVESNRRKPASHRLSEIGETGEAHSEALPLKLGLDVISLLYGQGSCPDASKKNPRRCESPTRTEPTLDLGQGPAVIRGNREIPMERYRNRGCLTGAEDPRQFSEESEFLQIRDCGGFQSPADHAGLELFGLREICDFGRDVFRHDESVVLVGSEKIRPADKKEVDQDAGVTDNE